MVKIKCKYKEFIKKIYFNFVKINLVSVKM